MATTRLTQIGIGGESYAGFQSKASRSGVQITRLTQAGIGGARYLGFQAKTAAQPQPETEVPVFGSGRRQRPILQVRPQPVVGDGNGILPAIIASAAGWRGVVGRGRVVLPSIHGQADGQLVTAADVAVRLVGLVGTAEAEHGNDGDGQARLAMRASSIGTSGQVGDAGATLPILAARSRGAHEPDELLALLLAA